MDRAQVLIFNENHERLIKEIDAQIQAIRHSSSFYRNQAKNDKLKVLIACRKYLYGDLNKEDFEKTLVNHKKYKDSIFKSKTKGLVQQVIKVDEKDIKSIFKSSLAENKSNGVSNLINKKL